MTADRVLVVGASGFLGRAVSHRLADRGKTVVGTYCSRPTPEASVQFDFWNDDLAPVVDRHDVDAVVFAAAVEYGGDADTGDTGSEADFVASAHRFADACAGVRLLYVSSSAVFDGTDGQYDETDEPSPCDRYGRRLVTFENCIREACTHYAILRTSYLYGFSAGELDHRLARTRNRIANGDSVAYFDDMYKSPFAVSEAAMTVEALLQSARTGVFHVPSPRLSVYRFHVAAMDALGYDSSLIEPEPIPDEMDVARDRSLSSDRFTSTVGFDPSRVGEVLSSPRETPRDSVDDCDR